MPSVAERLHLIPITMTYHAERQGPQTSMERNTRLANYEPWTPTPQSSPSGVRRSRGVRLLQGELDTRQPQLELGPIGCLVLVSTNELRSVAHSTLR